MHKVTQTRNKQMTKATIFPAGETVEIIGMQRDCECFHCGRPLKIGVVLAGFGGAFGAQCVARAAKPQVAYGYTQKLNGDRIKERAIAAYRGDKNANGWTIGGPVFKLELKSPLHAQ
jgi:hypothetical protein